MSGLPPGKKAATSAGRRPTPAGANRLNRGGGELDSLAWLVRLIRSGVETRRELEEASGLGRAVVADRLATLDAFGLIDESATAGSSVGRAPRRIQFRPSAGHILVAAIGNTSLGVGLVDLDGRLLVEHHELAGPADGPPAGADAAVCDAYTLDRIEELFNLAIADHPEARPWGIGLAIGGPVELLRARGASATADSPPGVADRELPGAELAASRLGKEFGVGVRVDNDAHLMALSELRSGRGVGRDDLLFLKVGTSVSVGLCVGGRLYRGANGFAGDIGHLVVESDGPLCRCGNTGCLEAIVGGPALAREATAAAETSRSPYLARLRADGRQLSAADVGHGAYVADPFCVELLSKSGHLIGMSLAALVSAFDPSMVVVGGGVAQSGEVLINAMRESLYRHSRSKALLDVSVMRSEMGRSASLVGAGIAVSDDLFSRERLRTWIGSGSPVALTTTADLGAGPGPGRFGALRSVPMPRDEP